MTDKDIREAIENCYWRTKVTDVWVCSGDIAPCSKLIDEGKCDTLIRLYAKERDTESE